MPETELSPFISQPLTEAVSTSVDTDSPITCDHARKEASREAWQDVIDRKLIEWGRDPSQLDEEGFETPSRDTIAVAVAVARLFGKKGLPGPARVVADPDGRIVFEYEENDVFESFRISSDQLVEYRGFKGCDLIAGRRWRL